MQLTIQANVNVLWECSYGSRDTYNLETTMRANPHPCIWQYETHLDSLEKKISLAQERALEQAETDSLGTSLGPDDDTNYTYAEPEQDHPDQQLGSPSDNMMGYSGLYG